MTTQNRLITVAIFTLLCWGCKDDNPMPQDITPVISNITLTVIDESTARCTFTVNPVGATQKAGVIYDTNPALSGEEVSTANVSGGNFTFELKNLTPNALYYYQVYIMDSYDSKINSDIERFITNTSPDVSVSNMFGNHIVAEPFGGGNGRENYPYLINNAQQLKYLVDYGYQYLGDYGFHPHYYKLMTDIIVTADEWIPISNFTQCNFDGNGYTISGTMKSDQYSAFGFFGYPVSEAKISNLTIAAAVINEHNMQPTSTGAIAGNIFWSLIINCQVTGTVTGGTGYNNFTGGIVGIQWGGEITNCTVSTTGIVIGRGDFDNTGGIAGYNARSVDYYGRIVNCTNHAAVSGKGNVGGIAGSNGCEIHTSLNTGNISGDTNNTGGIAGENSYNVYTHIYSCCTNRGTVNGQAANVNNQIGNGKDVEPCPDGHTKR